jgi:hypothetical protein
MAQVIDFAEIRGAREAQRAAADERRSLEDAIETIRLNLAAVVEHLRDAPADERAELLGRMEKLAAMFRYGLLLLDGPPHRVER